MLTQIQFDEEKGRWEILTANGARLVHCFSDETAKRIVETVTEEELAAMVDEDRLDELEQLIKKGI